MKTTVKRATVRLSHNEMDYFTFGSGKRQMVILPGMALKSIMNVAEGVASSYRLLSDEFTITVFDRTKFLTENYTLTQLAEDTAEAMQRLSIRNACVFGASQGGVMAMIIAIMHPKLVGRLALGSTAARLDPVSAQVMDKWMELAEQRDLQALLDCFVSVLYGRDFAEKFGAFIKLSHQDVTEADFERFIILGKSFDTLDIYDRLEQIHCPTLVLGAIDDKVLTAQASFEIAQKLGCACYFYESKYGHCAFDEAPDYKQRLLDFFTL